MWDEETGRKILPTERALAEMVAFCSNAKPITMREIVREALDQDLEEDVGDAIFYFYNPKGLRAGGERGRIAVVRLVISPSGLKTTISCNGSSSSRSRRTLTTSLRIWTNLRQSRRHSPFPFHDSSTPCTPIVRNRPRRDARFATPAARNRPRSGHMKPRVTF